MKMKWIGFGERDWSTALGFAEETGEGGRWSGGICQQAVEITGERRAGILGVKLG